MGTFSGVDKARFNEGGIYFLPATVTVGGKEEYAPANYLVLVDAVKLFKDRKDAKMFIVETTILYSEVATRKPGTTCSWVVPESWETFLGNVKHFAAIANDIDPSEVDEAGLEMIVSAENPVQGTLLALTASNIVTKVKKSNFTKIVWRQPTDEDVEKAISDYGRRNVKVPDILAELRKTTAA